VEAEHGLLARLQAIRGPSDAAGPALEMPPPTGQPSDDWRPYILRACLHSRLTQRFAPCLKERWPDKLAVAEELVYPDFRIRLPRFVTPEHQELWLQMCGPQRRRRRRFAGAASRLRWGRRGRAAGGAPGQPPPRPALGPQVGAVQ
jgi:hypothetical protein